MELEWIARRDSAVTSIDAAWLALERSEPTALRQIIAAMGLARDVLVEATAAGAGDGEEARTA